MIDTPITDKEIAILNATLDLVAERGFHGTPMSQVAKRSKVSAGIIYHYFENKDALMQALYLRIKTQFAAALLVDAPDEMLFPHNVVQLWHNAYRFYTQNPRETQYIEQFENSPYKDYWDEETMLSQDENMQRVAGIIGAEVAAGNVREMPPMVLYALTMGVALSLAKRHITGTLVLNDDDLNSVAHACLRAINV